MTDRGLWFLAFLLGVGLWFHAKTEQVYVLRRPVVLEFSGLDTSRYVILDVEPDTVWVEMEDRGKILLLHALSPYPRYRLRLSGLRLGRNALPLEKENLQFSVDAPADFRLLPPSILITVDRIRERRAEVDVPVRVEGSLLVVSRTLKPSRAEVRGPRTVLNTLTVVRTDTLVVEKAGDVDTTLPLLPPPLSRVEPGSVQISLTVAPPPSP